MSFFKDLDDSAYIGAEVAKCHVCRGRFDVALPRIEHSGLVQEVGAVDEPVEGHIYLHPECATVLILRLAADVMREPHRHDNGAINRRVVDTLKR